MKLFTLVKSHMPADIANIRPQIGATLKSMKTIIELLKRYLLNQFLQTYLHQQLQYLQMHLYQKFSYILSQFLLAHHHI